MSEYEMDWAAGYYDQLHQMLYDGELTAADVTEMYKKRHITEYQYNFAMDYLKEVEG